VECFFSTGRGGVKSRAALQQAAAAAAAANLVCACVIHECSF